jgi:hypothetical protein
MASESVTLDIHRRSTHTSDVILYMTSDVNYLRPSFETDLPSHCALQDPAGFLSTPMTRSLSVAVATCLEGDDWDGCSALASRGNLPDPVGRGSQPTTPTSRNSAIFESTIL